MTITIPGYAVSALIALYFYAVIANYQQRQIQELNAGLERTVQERTEDLRQAQAKLVQSEKIAALSQLVAGVAHEVNNPLGAVRSMHDTRVRAIAKLEQQLSPLSSEDAKSARPRKIIAEADGVVSEGLERIERIITRLRSFAHLDEADRQRVDLNKEIISTLAVMGETLGQSVKIERDLGDIPQVLCNPRQINQVLVNLLGNAAEAMNGDGCLTVESSRCGGSAVQVALRDTGLGIPAEDLKHVFDPGFTTRGVGVGTGLGLTICYQVIQEHGGDIELESAPGEGTLVRLTLPIG